MKYKLISLPDYKEFEKSLNAAMLEGYHVPAAEHLNTPVLGAAVRYTILVARMLSQPSVAEEVEHQG